MTSQIWKCHERQYVCLPFSLTISRVTYLYSHSPQMARSMQPWSQHSDHRHPQDPQGYLAQGPLQTRRSLEIRRWSSFPKEVGCRQAKQQRALSTLRGGHSGVQDQHQGHVRCSGQGWHFFPLSIPALELICSLSDCTNTRFVRFFLRRTCIGTKPCLAPNPEHLWGYPCMLYSLIHQDVSNTCYVALPHPEGHDSGGEEESQRSSCLLCRKSCSWMWVLCQLSDHFTDRFFSKIISLNWFAEPLEKT